MNLRSCLDFGLWMRRNKVLLRVEMKEYVNES